MKFWEFEEMLLKSRSKRLIGSWLKSIIRIITSIGKILLRKNSLKLLRPMRLLKTPKKESYMIKEAKNWSIEQSNRKIKGSKEVLVGLVVVSGDLIFRIFLHKWEVVVEVKEVLIVFLLEEMEGPLMDLMAFNKEEEKNKEDKDKSKMTIE